MDRNRTPIILSLIAILAISLFFRLYPLLTFVPHTVEEKASLIAIARLKKQVFNQVERQYPHISPFEKEQLRKKLFNEILHKEKGKIQQSILSLALKMKQQEPNQRNFPYLLGSDSYYYFGLTENILHQGKLGPKIRGSKYFNPLMLAPEGHWEPITLHPYIGALIYKLLKIFYPHIKPMTAVSFTPLLISIVAIWLFYLLCRFLNLPPISSLLGTLYFSLAPIFLRRSALGWYDNDPYNVLFPLIIFSIFFYEQRHWTSRKSLLAPLSLIATFVIYSLFWQGWVYFFAITMGTSVVISLLHKTLLPPSKGSLSSIWLMVLIAFGTFVGISLIFGFHDFFLLFQEGGKALKNFLQPQFNQWPDVFLSVGELKQTSFAKLNSLLGGPVFTIIAFIGLIPNIKFILKRTYPYSLFATTILLYFFASLFITMGAERFAILLLVPISILFAQGLQFLIEKQNTLLQKVLRHKQALYIFIVSMAVLFVAIPLKTAHEMMLTWRPIYNDIWDSVLKTIKKETPPQSIINSWWTPGHFIKAIANRRVTFDGATLNVPQAYWMANVFLSQNENLAVGILRMLNNSANEATTYLQKEGFPLSKAVEIVKSILPFSKEKSLALLSSKLSKKQIRHLLALTHSTPPPSFLLLTNELVEKNIQFSFIGHWNFAAVEAINKDPDSKKTIPPKNSPEYMSFLWQLIGGAPHYSGPLAEVGRKGDWLLFEQNLKINLVDKRASIASRKYGKGIPFSIIYTEAGQMKEKIFPSANLKYSVVLSKKETQYTAILMDTPLARSLLIRLYFFDGVGLRYFKPFIKKEDLTGRTTIFVYKILWPN